MKSLLQRILTSSRFLVILLVSACSSLPEHQLPPTEQPIDLSNTLYFREVKALEQKHPGQSGFYALSDAMDALAARIALINEAEARLDVQYYIWHDDLAGKTLHNRLLHAADRGVKVRLLLDDLDTQGKSSLLASLQYHPNIEIRLFNPFPSRDSRWYDFLSDGSRLNHRMHNKSITADGSISIVGGRNIGDEYFNSGEEVGFSDLDVVAIGPVAQDIKGAFETFWSSRWTYPLQQIDKTRVTEEQYNRFRKASDEHYTQASFEAYAKIMTGRWGTVLTELEQDNFSWGDWQLWFDNPDTVSGENLGEQDLIAPRLVAALDKAEKEMVIVSPYFVPRDFFTDFLVKKAKEGVRIKILTNSLASNDVTLVYSGYSRYRERLLKAGIELFEFKPINQHVNSSGWKGASRASLHGKYLQIDQHSMFVGSFNLDPRSANINTEIGVLFDSPHYASYLSKIFAADVLDRAYKVELDSNSELVWHTKENGSLISYDKAPKTSWWDRFMAGLLSYIVPESEL